MKVSLLLSYKNNRKFVSFFTFWHLYPQYFSLLQFSFFFFIHQCQILLSLKWLRMPFCTNVWTWNLLCLETPQPNRVQAGFELLVPFWLVFLKKKKKWFVCVLHFLVRDLCPLIRKFLSKNKNLTPDHFIQATCLQDYRVV